MSAASQAQRTAEQAGRDIEIVALERGPWTSYSACGIPYWVSGTVQDRDDLIARTPEQHRARGIDVRLYTEAVGIDLDRRTVTVQDVAGGTDGPVLEPVPFDQLVLATGAVPKRPPIPGMDATGVHGLQTLADGHQVIDWLEDEQPERAVIVGAGYIGLEMAEAMVLRGAQVTVLDQAPEPMTTLDSDLGAEVRKALEGLGIDVVTEVEVTEFESTDGTVSAVRTADGRYPADIVLLGLGVAPNTRIASEAGLPVGEFGGLRVDERMAVPGHPGIWAAGDCVEVHDRVSGERAHIPLGTHANRQGRVLGTNIAGGQATYPGMIRTAASKVCGLEIARTGLGESSAAEAGFDAFAVTTESTTTAGYYPGAESITIKVIADRSTGRLIGAQIVGGQDSAKRIDTLALAVWQEITVDELAMVDLSYAPPFSPTLDPVTIAARRTAERL